MTTRDNEDIATPDGEPPESRALRVVRVGFAAVIVLFVVVYTAGVLSGRIGVDNQLSATHVALLGLCGIAATIAIWPQALKYVRSVSAGTFRLDLIEREQAGLQHKQQELAAQLQLLQEILPLILPATERRHLEALDRAARGQTLPAYHGSNALRKELRHLRDLQLIALNRNIAEIPDDRFDLADIARLTPAGRHWVKRADEVGTFDYQAPKS
jgi:hypothetical protein